MSEWREYCLNEIGLLKRGKSKHRPRYAFHLYGGPYPFIQTGDVKAATKYINTFSQTYSEAGLSQSMLWQKGTLCITIAANIADIAILGFDACFPDSILGFLANEKLSNQDFVYYLLISAKKELLTYADGSVQDNINLGTFEQFRFLIPPLPTQRAIAEILSSLDDKIDLLTRQNATLEALAQTYFRQWFVEGAREDWDECLLSDFVIVRYGKDHKYLNGGQIPVYGSGGIMRYADTALYDKESVLIPRKGSLGNVIYINAPFWSVDTMFYTEMKHANIAKFIYFFIKDLNLVAMNVGSAVPSMTTDVLNTLPLTKPPEKLLKRFDIEIATPLFNKINANTRQISTLQKLRDTLLPKLVSGEVRVKN